MTGVRDGQHQAARVRRDGHDEPVRHVQRGPAVQPHLQLLPIVHSPVDGLVGEQVAKELAVDRLVGRRRPVEVQRGRQRRDLRFQERRRRGWF